MRRREIVHLVVDPREHAREFHACAPLAREEAQRRCDVAVARMRRARETLVMEVSGLSGFDALRNDQWSVMHVLAHLGGAGGGHFEPVYEIVLRGATTLEPFEKREERLQYAIEAALARIDESIDFAQGLSPDQLMLSARRDGSDVSVLELCEAAAQHLDQHVEQLRQLKERNQNLKPARSGGD